MQDQQGGWRELHRTLSGPELTVHKQLERELAQLQVDLQQQQESAFEKRVGAA